MKKTLSILLAALFVLSFAASAFAIHAEIPAETQAVVGKGTTQIILGGEIRYRGWYYNNMGTPTGTATAGGTSGYPQDSPSKANSDMRVRLNVEAQVSPNVTGMIQLETGTTTDIYTFGALNSRSGTLTNLAQAWIQYSGSGLFGFPSFIKVGHMPLKLGNGLFFDNTQYGDDAIVFAMDPTKDLHIGLITVKAAENSAQRNTDDTDAYVALFTYKMGANNFGMNYMYINNDMNNTEFQNLGLHANGMIGGFGYAAEADFQFGDISSSVKAGGWAAQVKANYKMAPANLRAMFAYGSGDKDTTGNKNEEFQTLVGGIVHYTFVYDYRTSTAAMNQAVSGQAAGTLGTGIANTTVYNLGVDYQFSKALKGSLDAFVLRANKVEPGCSKKIGTEFDANITYQVAKNLTYAINAGIFDAGKFYADNAKTATVINHVLTLSF